MSALHRAIQRIHTIADAPRLTRFYLNPPKTVEVEFANGSKFNLSAEFLRVYSPAADGKIRSVGGEKTPRGDNVCRTSGELWGKVASTLEFKLCI
ncbi:hypothetical protein SLEP1_g48846 [Rubroshorea leprosula]|uniref:Gamma-butyrobetaine hydroxylase-like N-terminal domain-containing protein n=1 Tax=Rubroshorea leprosula TaxID=152421 RepID=A0AAV5LVQ6_9ROSI|nr:hypothetical protein SLEP1_g48846 [Rubroshorea leprosula]